MRPKKQLSKHGKSKPKSNHIKRKQKVKVSHCKLCTKLKERLVKCKAGFVKLKEKYTKLKQAKSKCVRKKRITSKQSKRISGLNDTEFQKRLKTNALKQQAVMGRLIQNLEHSSVNDRELLRKHEVQGAPPTEKELLQIQAQFEKRKQERRGVMHAHQPLPSVKNNKKQRRVVPTIMVK